MEKEYLVIYFGEDGCDLSMATKQEVESLVADVTSNSDDDRFLDLPHGITYGDSHSNYPIYKYLIVKGGKAIIPRPIEKVIKYEID